jgi:hypothetical protein
MEVHEVVALCFSSFSLGMLTNLGLYLLIVRPWSRKAEKSDRREWGPFEEEEKCCGNCKHHSKGSKDNPCSLCEDVNDIPDQWEAIE